jgi:HSP20 family protein
MTTLLPVRRSRLPLRRGYWPWEGWDPFADLADLWERMGRMVEQFEDGGREWVPVAEEEETSDAYLVRAELPGVAREDIEVEVRGDDLCISGEMKEEHRTEHALRRRAGKFSYRTRLPGDADADRIEAKLADGVLTVRLPKTGQARARHIEITG